MQFSFANSMRLHLQCAAIWYLYMYFTHPSPLSLPIFLSSFFSLFPSSHLFLLSPPPHIAFFSLPLPLLPVTIYITSLVILIAALPISTMVLSQSTVALQNPPPLLSSSLPPSFFPATLIPPTYLVNFAICIMSFAILLAAATMALSSHCLASRSNLWAAYC